MYDYHAGMIWTIDAWLGAAIAALSILILAYSAMQWRSVETKRKRLLKLKENLYAIFTPQGSSQTCPRSIQEIGSEEFLDIVTNRRLWAAFFNQAEQSHFKDCFVSGETVKRFEQIAARGRNKWRRIEAILALGYAQAASAMGIFEKGLFGKDQDVSYFSLMALGQIKTDLSARILLEYLRTHRGQAQKVAAIMETFPHSAADEAVKLLGDADVSVRAWALTILSRFNPEAYLKTIEKCALDVSEYVRAEAAKCLGTAGAGGEKTLTGLLRDPSWMVRMSAARGLESAIGAGVSRRIAGLLNDNSLRVIDAVKDILVRHIDTSAPLLERVIEGNDVLAKRSAIEVLSRGGYVDRVLAIALSKDMAPRAAAQKQLAALIHAGANLSVFAAVQELDHKDRAEAISLINGIDQELAGSLSERFIPKG